MRKAASVGSWKLGRLLAGVGVLAAFCFGCSDDLSRSEAAKLGSAEVRALCVPLRFLPGDQMRVRSSVGSNTRLIANPLSVAGGSLTFPL
jgi:hypothetical protein